jgi:hypothetical protein
MKQTKAVVVLAGLMVFLSAARPAGASVIAYTDPTDVGNQVWNGSLGEDFTVLSPITVTSLGVFNSGQTGTINGTLTVAIFSDSGTQETPTLTFSGTTGTLVGGDLFLNLATPVTLPVGNYSVTTAGWDPSDLDGNANCVGNLTCGSTGGPYTPPTLNDGGGLISFTGVGFLSGGGLQYLGPVAPYPADEFNAGSFQFSAEAAAGTPEPKSVVEVMLGVLLVVCSRLRRSSRAATATRP